MSKFATLFLTLTFAGAVVALGIQDLERIHAKEGAKHGSAEAERIRNLMFDLQGDLSSSRARLAEGPKQVTVGDGSTAPQQDADTGKLRDVFKKLAP